MKATFGGREYPLRMIAEHQRSFWIAITALTMMQKFYGNPYYSFKCVSDKERDEWYAKAEAIAPAVEDVVESV